MKCHEGGSSGSEGPGRDVERIRGRLELGSRILHPRGTMTAAKRAYVETYGCQMNISDGELMEGILERSGFRIVAEPQEADVVLVNTCAIREHAEQRVLGRVSQLNALKEERPHVRIGVTGCMAQRMGSDLLEKAPYVDLVMGPDGYRGLPEELARLEEGGNVKAPPHAESGPASGSEPDPVRDGVAGGRESVQSTAPNSTGRGGGKRGPQLAVLDLDPRENYQGLEQRRRSGVTAWVPVQRGCDHRCTYCIVPYVRGPEKNRSPHEVLAEVQGIVRDGITEVTLLGQTVNSYRHEDWSFADLLRSVARVPGIHRVRYTSPHPNDVTEDLLQVMAEEPAVCEHLHLPLQAGNDRTLKRMVRRYTVERFLEKVELARSAVPDLALSTDVIVAFPGETEAEFRDTLEVMRTVRFDDAFTYRFSPRDGTPATRFPESDFVDEDVAKRRLQELIDLTRGIQREINEREVGRVDEILVEKPARRPGQMLGRTRRFKAVAVPGDESLVGAYRRARLTETTGATFAGVPLDEAEGGSTTGDALALAESA